MKNVSPTFLVVDGYCGELSRIVVLRVVCNLAERGSADRSTEGY